MQSLDAFRYYIRFLVRRVPQALRRRLEVRRSSKRLSLLAAGPDSATAPVIALHVAGVVGDSIMAARFLRDLAPVCGSLQIDVFAANLPQSRWIFASVTAVRGYFQDTLFGTVAGNYGCALLFTDSVSVVSINPDLLASFPKRVTNIIERIRGFAQDHDKMAESHHRAELLMAQELWFRHGQTRATVSQYLAGIPYGGPEFAISVENKLFDKHGLSGRRYVTVHNGFSLAEIPLGRTSTKSYMKFGQAIEIARRTKPDILFIQLGAATSVPIEGIDINLMGLTTLPEAACMIKNAAAHLDNESGFVSLASCFGTPSCVVYGPTSADYYSYPGNVEVRPTECGCCWWVAGDWMTRCPRGMAIPVCMDRQPPEAVAAALLQLLGEPR